MKIISSTILATIAAISVLGLSACSTPKSESAPAAAPVAPAAAPVAPEAAPVAPEAAPPAPVVSRG